MLLFFSRYISSDRSELIALLRQVSTTLPSFAVVIAGYVPVKAPPILEFKFAIKSTREVAAGLGKSGTSRGYAYVNQGHITNGLCTEQLSLDRPADARSDGAEGIELPTDEEAIQTQSDEWRFTAYGEMRNWEVDEMNSRLQGLPGFVRTLTNFP